MSKPNSSPVAEIGSPELGVNMLMPVVNTGGDRTTGEVVAGRIFIENCWLADPLAASVTVIVGVESPGVMGIPEMTPVVPRMPLDVARFRPFGRLTPMKL